MDFSRITEDSELCKKCYEAGNLEIEQFRICRFSDLIANYVINEKGEFDEALANEVIKNFQIKPYGEFDSAYASHLKKILNLFFQKKIQLKLRQLSFPLANRWVETLVGKEKRDISVSLLKALLIFLRQTVGSCFATAPLILVQTNQPEFLFEDLYNLITRGFLKRVVDGIEYKAPISIKTSWNLDFESPLLRCYEYTVASFADAKTELYKWNVTTALGIDTKEEKGIGEAVFKILQEKLDFANSEIEALSKELFHAEDRYKTAEAFFRSAKDVDEARRLEMQAKSEAHHFYVLKEMIEEKKEGAEKIASFYPFFIDELLRLFPLYFQEVFDPEMQKGSGEILEDRPAGFRLLFKHGKSDPTGWTMIYEEKEYLQAIEEFFRLAEVDIAYTADFKGSKQLIQEIIDAIIQMVREKTFVKTAFTRIEKMRRRQDNQVVTIEPWAYISGGNLESLASCYFGLKNRLIRNEFFPETPTDLCIMLIEYMKDLPYQVSKEFEENPMKGILMTNEVHAFVFKPGLKSFLEAWQQSGNTYTYIRDYTGIIPFADTNWSSDLFCFALDEKSNKLALFRKGTFGLKPLPDSWKSYFSKTSPWTLWTITT
jgi:hypothetical protein